jgi:hypothetical protein
MKPFAGQFVLRTPFHAPDADEGAAEAPNSYGEAPLTADLDEREETAPPESHDPEPEAHEEREEAAAEPEPAAEAAAEGEGEPDPTEEAPKPRKDWRQARIDKVTAEKKAAEERAKAAEERAAALEALYGNQEGEDGKTAPKLYTEAEVLQRAQQLARQNDLNARADKLFDDGAAKYKDWTAKLAEVNENFGTDLQQRPDIFDAITRLPNAADVYYALGADLDQMAHVLELTPVELGMELKGLSDKLAKPKAPVISKAPAPIKPLGHNTVEEMPLDQLLNDPSDKAFREFDRRMAREEEKRYGARR